MFHTDASGRKKIHPIFGGLLLQALPKVIGARNLFTTHDRTVDARIFKAVRPIVVVVKVPLFEFDFVVVPLLRGYLMNVLNHPKGFGGVVPIFNAFSKRGLFFWSLTGLCLRGGGLRKWRKNSIRY